MDSRADGINIVELEDNGSDLYFPAVYTDLKLFGFAREGAVIGQVVFEYYKREPYGDT